APAVVAVDLPPVPPVVLTDVPPIEPLALDLAPLTSPLSVAAAAPALGASGGGGTGGGTGAGAGRARGPGTGGEGGYIFPPDPRGAIVPPLDGVPRAVRGRPHRVTWWIAADGGIERVEVSPPIRDERYRREFLERMRSYTFTPARTPDGRAVPGVVTIIVTP
ncbi:MAG TPA: hypothetical protein VNI61_05145, partial [Gemmatimonadales bacterium]|nr:hypothetical protein [Gemmatimonadales bacterium]